MKYRIISLLSAALIILSWALQAGAEEINEKPPNMSFGISGSFSGLSVWERKKSSQQVRYNPAPGYGGGIVFEKMYNNLLGIQSGIWFNRINIDMRMKQPVDIFSAPSLMSMVSMKLVLRGWALSVPLSLVLSFNASIFSFNILGGIKYTHILETRAKPDRLMLTFKRSYDLLPYLSHPQFGFTLGINFKFRIARFTDLFIGCGGVLYVTNLIRGNNDISHLYDISALSGVMFRTNIFPMRE